MTHLRLEEDCTLSMLLGETNTWTTPFVFIFGQHSCGKSEVLKNVLNRKQVSHVIVNCVECYTSSLLYQHVLEGLYCPDDRLRCDDVNQFVSSLKATFGDSDKATCIVFDKAEVLRHHPSLHVLLQLQQLTSCNLCVILVSTIAWDKYCVGTALPQPALLHFPDYTKDELVEILCQRCPRDSDVEVYRDFVTMLLGVFGAACKDVRELKHVADVNFRFYSNPIEAGEISRHDKRKLWKRIEPKFYTSLQELYLRKNQSGQASQSKVPDLPFYSKFLLIAAYIASYNPATSDRRFFVKRTGKLRSANTRWARKNYHLHGPRPFSLDRMMAIFYSIVDERVPPTAALFSQISSLTSLHLLARVSHSDQIDCPRYKCVAPLSVVIAVSKTVDFDVTHYLYDFL